MPRNSTASHRHSGGPAPAPRKTLPAYAKVERYLRSLIEAGGGREEPLPDEQALATKFNVSRMTARQGFQRLVSSGVVVRFRGRGSFVNAERGADERPVFGTVGVADWSESARGYSRRVLCYALRPAPRAVADLFGIPKGHELTYFEGLRISDGRVLCRDIRYLPATVHREISVKEIEQGQLMTLLPSHGLQIAERRVEITSQRASKADAKSLGIETAASIIEALTSVYNNAGELIVYERTAYPLERFSYRVRITPLQSRRTH